MDGSNASIEAAALRFYARLPPKAKPQAHEYTCCAAIVAAAPAPRPPRVVALATGTKCVGAGAQCARGLVVVDCHAEVLARRALARCLLLELRARYRALAAGGAAFAEGEHCLLERSSSSSGAAGQPPLFQLRAGLQLHLYISDSPCGEAAVYADAGAHADAAAAAAAEAAGAPGGGARRTGAKALGAPGAGEGAGSAAPPPPALRIKSGRSDLPAHARTRAMCCSDKVARWVGLGLQGALAAHFLARPLPLASVVVSGGEGWGVTAAGAAGSSAEQREHQARALQRALLGRAGHCHAAAAAVLGQVEAGAGGAAPTAVALRVCELQYPGGMAQRSAAAVAAAAAAEESAAASRKRPREGEGEGGAAAAELAVRAPPAPLTGSAGSGAAIVPSGTSLVALVDHCGQVATEGLLGAAGRRMGSSKSTPPERAASLVCKASLGELFADVWRAAAAAAAAAAVAAASAGAGAAAAAVNAEEGASAGAAAAACAEEGAGAGAAASGSAAAALPATYRAAKQGSSGHIAGALLPLHLAAKRAWHGARAPEGSDAQGLVDFSAWLHGEEQWEGFSLPSST